VASVVLDDDRAVPVLCAVFAVAAAAFVGYALIDKAELIDDERAYLFQAKLLAHGKLSEHPAWARWGAIGAGCGLLIGLLAVVKRRLLG
jgi:hypothetical protein